MRDHGHKMSKPREAIDRRHIHRGENIVEIAECTVVAKWDWWIAGHSDKDWSLIQIQMGVINDEVGLLNDGSIANI